MKSNPKNNTSIKTIPLTWQPYTITITCPNGTNPIIGTTTINQAAYAFCENTNTLYITYTFNQIVGAYSGTNDFYHFNLPPNFEANTNLLTMSDAVFGPDEEGKFDSATSTNVGYGHMVNSKYIIKPIFCCLLSNTSIGLFDIQNGLVSAVKSSLGMPVFYSFFATIPCIKTI